MNTKCKRDYKPLYEEQKKALKLLNERLRIKERDIKELNKEVGRLRAIIRTKKGLSND